MYYLSKFFVLLFSIIVLTNLLYSQEANWLEIGSSTNNISYVTDIVCDNDGVVYFSTDNNGVFISSDKGQNWFNTVVDAHHAAGMIDCMHAMPDGTVFTAAKTGYTHYTMDKGQSWIPLIMFNSLIADIDDNTDFVYIAYKNGEVYYGNLDQSLSDFLLVFFDKTPTSIDISQSGIVYLATSDGGVFKITGKQQYQELNNGLPGLNVNVVKVGEGDLVFTGLADNGGFYKSTDAGANWYKPSTALDGKIINDIELGWDNVILAATDAGLFISEDKGETWTDFNGSSLVSKNITSVAIDKDNYIYTGTTDGKIFRLENPYLPDSMYLGITAQPYTSIVLKPGQSIDYIVKVVDFQNNPVEGAIIHTNEWANKPTDASGTAVLPLNIDDNYPVGEYSISIYATKENYNNSKILIRKYTVKSDKAWTKIESYSQNYKILSFLTDGESKFLGGTESNSLMGSNDGGTTWYYASNGISMSSKVADIKINSRNEIFAATSEDGVLKSTNWGQSWVKCNPSAVNIFDIELFGDDIIFAASSSSGLYISLDEGTTWNIINSRPKVPLKGLLAGASGRLFIAAGINGVVYTDDNGENWTGGNNGLNGITVNYLFEANSGEIYAGTDNKGVYKSSDYGESWSPANKGIDKMKINKIYCGKPGQVFAASEGNGVYFSSDKGENWIEFNEGFELLNPKDVYSFCINSNFIFTGASDGGIYKREVPTATSVDDENHSENNNICIFPNPSDGIFNISVPESETIKQVSIYNLLSERVKNIKTNSNTLNVNMESESGQVYLVVIETIDGRISIDKVICK